MNDFRIRVMVAEGFLITGPEDFDYVEIMASCDEEDLEDVARKVIKESYPELVIISIEIDPMFN